MLLVLICMHKKKNILISLNCICEDQILIRDNNIPGILPGGIPGDTLGLECKPELNLFTPLPNPPLCIKNKMCPKYNPYNGSYCQCTNNTFKNSDTSRYMRQQF